jgi:hypothetical protein
LHLTPTKPVREGWVLPEDLLDFHGRGRYAQLNLATKLGVKDFPSPAGGCLLTDRNYCLRLKDLMDRRQESLDNLELLAYGRHFRLSEDTKLIVGRNEEDNNALEALFTDGYRVIAKQIFGPLGLVVGGEPDEHLLQLALGIFYSYHHKVDDGEPLIVQLFKGGKQVGPDKEYIGQKADRDTCVKYQITY